MYLYRQYDSRWGKKYYRANSAGTSTMSSSGCGPSACANVEQFFDASVTPWVAAQWMMKYGYATNGQGTLHSGIKNYFLAMGQSSTWLTERAGNQYGKDAEEYASAFREAIKAGHYGVLLMGKSAWTSAGHYIAVVDYKVDGELERFYVIDSGIKQRNGWWSWTAFKTYVKHFYVIKNPAAGKKKYDGAFPSKFPFRGYYRYGDGWKTCTSGTYILQIKHIQIFLNWAVSAGLTIDGQYGAQTAAACKLFQIKTGLSADGEFGRHTLAAAKAYFK